MSKLGWFVAGIAIGAVAVVQLRDNPKAQIALDDAIEVALSLIHISEPTRPY